MMHDGVMIDAGGERVALRFDWAALGALRLRFGPDWATRVETAFVEQAADDMAAIMEAGSGRPAAWWLEASPPLVPAAHAARRALLIAFHGPDAAPEAAPADPRTAAAMTIRRRIATWFAAAIGRGRPQAVTR